MKALKALVLSGGSGTRLRPFTFSTPKQLIPIANRPVLEYAVDNIRNAGVQHIGVVVGDRGPEIQRALGTGFTYIHQPQPLGLAHAVKLARDFLGDDDFVLYLGDTVLADGIADVVRDFRARRPAAHIMVRKVADARRFGIAELDREGNLARVVEKPRRPKSNLAIIGMYCFTSAIHDAIDTIRPSARGELEITDAIQVLLDRGIPVKVSEYTGYWRDAGKVEDILDCNRRMLCDLRSCIAGGIDRESRITGPIVLETGARVVRSRIEGPVIIAAGTVIEDSHIGPQVSIGRDCVIRRTRLQDSIVLDGATLSHAADLRGSLIGRSAVVAARNGLSKTENRLVIGDHSRIEIAV